MKIEIDVHKHYHQIGRYDYLSCQISINGKWFKEVVTSSDSVSDMLKCVEDSLQREIDVLPEIEFLNRPK